eukprot:TRINITY_DN12923_c1_g1_i1.p1 TRINITY_DN12923_c1_g1~~TRINITY_DN12923_c1_g1_i1.p1  ORF type:complete len:273 (-),score=43.38 TRINITY_DN12923_c1_g1_i1:47-799(-)
MVDRHIQIEWCTPSAFDGFLDSGGHTLTFNSWCFVRGNAHLPPSGVTAWRVQVSGTGCDTLKVGVGSGMRSRGEGQEWTYCARTGSAAYSLQGQALSRQETQLRGPVLRDGSVLECVFCAQTGSLGFTIDAQALQPFPAFLGVPAEKVYPIVGSAATAVSSIAVDTMVDINMEGNLSDFVGTSPEAACNPKRIFDCVDNTNSFDEDMEELEFEMQKQQIDIFKKRRTIPPRRVVWDDVIGKWSDLAEARS